MFTGYWFPRTMKTIYITSNEHTIIKNTYFFGFILIIKIISSTNYYLYNLLLFFILIFMDKIEWYLIIISIRFKGLLYLYKFSFIPMCIINWEKSWTLKLKSSCGFKMFKLFYRKKKHFLCTIQLFISTRYKLPMTNSCAFRNE